MERKGNLIYPDWLTCLAIPELSEMQLGQFNCNNLRTHLAITFDPEKLLVAGQRRSKVLAIDIGGTAIKAYEVRTEDGKIECVLKNKEDKVDVGDNYYKFLKNFPKKDWDHIAISVAGKVIDGELIESENFRGFVEDLRQNGGFKYIYGEVFVVNDAVAAAIGGYSLASSRFPEIENGILMINGGGIGGAVVNNDGEVIANEPGHIPVVDSLLNPNSVTKKCNFYDQEETCLERIGSMREIEAQWEVLYHQKKTGQEIAELMYVGDNRALRLIDLAAFITATAFEGLRQANNININNLVIIGQGGAFKIKGFGERVRQILLNHYCKMYHFDEKAYSTKLLPVFIPGDGGIDNFGAVGAALGAIAQSA